MQSVDKLKEENAKLKRSRLKIWLALFLGLDFILTLGVYLTSIGMEINVILSFGYALLTGGIISIFILVIYLVVAFEEKEAASC